MAPATDIVDISSDEEDDDDLGWLNEMLDSAPDGADGADDVVVVGELSAPAVKRSAPLNDSDDDDCLVLDGDPERPVDVVVDDKSGGSDELLIVGEKGQLACRDYPHPRHLCATFPFSTTPHEKHCNMCHCYVCDSPAPCIYWSKGVPTMDHCHSTDKEGQWRQLRKSLKQRNLAPPPEKLPDTSLSTKSPLQNPVSVTHTVPTSLSSQSRPGIFRHAVRVGVATPRPVNQRHLLRPTVTGYSGQRLSQHLSRSHPVIPGIQYIQRENHGANALAARIIQSPAKLRRVESVTNNPSNNSSNVVSVGSKFGSVGTAANDRSNIGTAANNLSNMSQYVVPNHKVHRAVAQKFQFPPASLVEENMKKWQDILEGVGVATEGIPPQELSSSVFSQYDPPTNATQNTEISPSVFSQHSQTNTIQNLHTSAHYSLASTSPSSIGFDYGSLSNNTSDHKLAGYGTAEPVTVQPSIASVSGQTQMDGILASVGLGSFSEPAGKAHGFLGLDADPLLSDFDNVFR